MLHFIESVTRRGSTVVDLTFRAGETITVDLRPLIDSGGVFASLADPAVFQQVTVGGGGRFLEWPGEVDLCADALWLSAHGQDGREAA